MTLHWLEIFFASCFFLKLVDSTSGPGLALAQALWHSGDTNNQVSNSLISLKGNTNIYEPYWYNHFHFFKVKLLWQDPNMEGWNYQTSYAFHVTHRPSIGLIRYEMTALMTCGSITIQYNTKSTVCLRPQRGGRSYTQSVVKPVIFKLQQYNNIRINTTMLD